MTLGRTFEVPVMLLGIVVAGNCCTGVDELDYMLRNKAFPWQQDKVDTSSDLTFSGDACLSFVDSETMS